MHDSDARSDEHGNKAHLRLIAAGAWNKAIIDLIAIFLRPGAGVVAEFIYAIIITIIAIVVVQNLGKLAQRDLCPKA